MLCNEKCPRGLDTCTPLSNLVADDDSQDFVCVGLNNQETRKVAQDKYTHCFKNPLSDSRFNFDAYDLQSVVAVMSEALLIDQYLIVRDAK